MGGGGFDSGSVGRHLEDYLLSMLGKDRPRVCFVPTASGDDRRVVAGFFDAFAARTEATWLPLFERRDADLRALVLEQDAVFVWGGNTANMLAIWRIHGLDTILREAWAQGIVLAGMSAGAICWFEAGVTDSYGPELAPLRDGL
ncbi:MAG: Type 1 glutamine amidotransferase-like domain-containing protein, partial [Candidatus Limnocylindrales bacterium]